MAQGDIIDTMFGYLMELFGWIFKQFLKLAMWIIKILFKLTIGLIKWIWDLIFNREKPVAQEEVKKDVVENYRSLLTQIESIDTLKQSITSDSSTEDTEAFFNAFTQVGFKLVFSENISIRDKFRLLEQLNKRTDTYLPNEVATNYYTRLIERSYQSLYEGLDNSMMISEPMAEFKKHSEAKTLSDFTEDFKNIFAFAALFADRTKEVSIDNEDYAGLDLPKPKYA